MVPSVHNVPTSWYRVSQRHLCALRWCPVSTTYQYVDIESHTDIMAHLHGVQCLQHTNKLASSLTQTSQRIKMVSCVCNIPTSWHQVSHRHHGALRWCPVSATYQQVDIESHRDIFAHVDGFQCLQHTHKLAASLTRHHSALRWCPVSATYQQVGMKSHTDIMAHLDCAQCLQHTYKLISSLTQTSRRTEVVSSVCNIPTSWH